MKNWKSLLLCLIMVTGFIFPSCNEDDIDCNCSGVRFFDVEGLDVGFFKEKEQRDPILPDSTVQLAEIGSIYIDYIVDYHATIAPADSWSFSLMNSAFACSCIEGWEGSKDEKMVSFEIISLNDFDDQHLAGSVINDLFDYEGSYHGPEENISLDDFISNSLGQILINEDLILRLKKAPEINPEFKIKVKIELSAGEVYERESIAIKILP